ncbi:hypothetical protein V6N13_015740 [Hibiscus sabdariffa]|uniref:Uncharacterized protein n=1 Tax=Hibiscus sabdariffa TaxID=183260 RepID=A0ABR2CXC8_9ROSI
MVSLCIHSPLPLLQLNYTKPFPLLHPAMDDGSTATHTLTVSQGKRYGASFADPKQQKKLLFLTTKVKKQRQEDQNNQKRPPKPDKQKRCGTWLPFAMPQDFHPYGDHCKAISPYMRGQFPQVLAFSYHVTPCVGDFKSSSSFLFPFALALLFDTLWFC